MGFRRHPKAKPPQKLNSKTPLIRRYRINLLISFQKVKKKSVIFFFGKAYKKHPALRTINICNNKKGS